MMASYYIPKLNAQVYWQVGNVGHRTISGVVAEAIHEHGQEIRLLLIVFQVDQGVDLEYEVHLARLIYKDTPISINVFRWVNPRDDLWDAIEKENAKERSDAVPGSR